MFSERSSRENAGSAGRAERPRAPAIAAVWGGLAVLLVWCQLAFVGEFRRVGEIYREDRVSYRQSWLWRPDLRPQRELAAFLDAARAFLPEGSVAVFSSRSTSDRQDFARSLWAAYQLPELDLVPAARASAAERAAADFWIAYRTAEDAPGRTAVWRHPDGVVYRIDR